MTGGWDGTPEDAARFDLNGTAAGVEHARKDTARIRPVRQGGVEIPGVVVDGDRDGQARVLDMADGKADLTVMTSRGTFPAGVTLRPDEALALAAGLIRAAKGEAFLRALTEAMKP